MRRKNTGGTEKNITDKKRVTGSEKGVTEEPVKIGESTEDTYEKKAE